MAALLRKMLYFVSAMVLAAWVWADPDKEKEEQLLRALTTTRAGNYQRALPTFQRPAEPGHPSAQHDRGVMYAHGHSVFRNYQDAFAWYRKAAEQDHAKAEHNLDVMYDWNPSYVRPPAGWPGSRDVRPYRGLSVFNSPLFLTEISCRACIAAAYEPTLSQRVIDLGARKERCQTKTLPPIEETPAVNLPAT